MPTKRQPSRRARAESCGFSRLLYVPRRGCVYFSQRMTVDEIESALHVLTIADDATFDTLVHWHTWSDPTTGVSGCWPWYTAFPPTAIDISQTLAAAAVLQDQANAARAASLASATELRIGWMRRHAGLIAMPDNATQCGRCVSCGDTLAEEILFGHCDACGAAFKQLAFEDGITLPERQQRQ